MPVDDFVRKADGTFTANPAGEFATVTSYTGRNLVASVTEAAGTIDAATVTYAYSPTGQKASETDPRNPQWTTTYHYGTCCDRAEEIVDALGFISRITHDNKGNRTASFDALGHGTMTEYDAQSRAVKVSNSEHEISTITYDTNLTDGVGLDAVYRDAMANLGFGANASGSAVLTTNPAGQTTLKITDSLGRLRRAVDANGGITTASYQTLANGLDEVSVTDPLGKTVRQRKDVAGRVWSMVDADGHETVSTYDASGNVLTMRDANGVGFDAEYDALNRLVKRTDTSGAITRTAYDEQGNATDITDARGQTVHITYDARGRKATVTERIDVPPTRFAYDAAGHLSTITDAEHRVTTYVYDERGQLQSETYPAGQQTSAPGKIDRRSYAYDDARRLLTRTDQAGVVTTYGYDNANRMLTRTATDGSADAFVYDDAGRMTTATSGQYRTNVQRFYNSVGQLDHEIQDLGGAAATAATVSYRYDLAGRPTHVIYPDGRIVARAFTARGQLQQIWLGDDSVAIRDYDAAGRLKTTTLRNGLTEARTYQPHDNLLATLSVASASSASAVSFAYDFDENKRKTKETANHAPATIAQRFDYDNADRLIAWTKGGDSQNWDLSPVGDWNTTTRNGVTETRDHTPVHEVTRLSVPGQVTDLVYDTKGNLTRDANGASYTWDAENRLISASIHSASTRRPELSVDGRATYRYDALGRRLQKTIFGRTTTFVHDGDQIIQETDGTPSVAADSLQANDDGTGAGDPPGGALVAGALVRVNFQPATSYIPDGFVADKGRSLALRTNGKTYGWDLARSTDHAVIRGVYPYPQWDTHQRSVDGPDATGAEQTNAGTWKIAVENGTYAVALVMGDPITMNQTNDVTINGAIITDPTPAKKSVSSTIDRGAFDGYAVTATVTDGFITIAVPPSAKDSKLCFLEIGAKGSVADNALKQKVSDAVAKANRLTDQDFPPQNASPRVYVYGSYIDEPLAMEIGSGANARRYYLHANHLYSIAALSDATGTVVERYQYDAMGQRTILAANGITVLAASAYGNQIGFTGRYHDDETGLQYFRSRMYSASLGRFISRDSAGYVNGMGLYGAYFVPNAVDPSGQFLLALTFLTIVADLDVQITRANDDATKVDLAQTVFSAATTLTMGSVFRGLGAVPYGNLIGLTAASVMTAKGIDDTTTYLANLIASSDDAFNDPEVRAELQQMSIEALRDLSLSLLTRKYGQSSMPAFRRPKTACSKDVRPPVANRQLIGASGFRVGQIGAFSDSR